MTAASKAEQAIDRSVSHNEIVTIAHTAEAAEYLASQADDSVSHGAETEYWGTDEDGDNWRVHLRRDTREEDEATILREQDEEDHEVARKARRRREELAQALIDASDDGGTIQAAAMVPLAPGRPELHTTMTLRAAAEVLGVVDEAQAALGVDWLPRDGDRSKGLVVVVDGHTYEANLSRGPQDTRTGVSIYRDDVWAGNGYLSDGCEIVDCPADLPDEVFDALDRSVVAAMRRGYYAEMDPSHDPEPRGGERAEE